jgi:hypothetical protein
LIQNNGHVNILKKIEVQFVVMIRGEHFEFWVAD